MQFIDFPVLALLRSQKSEVENQPLKIILVATIIKRQQKLSSQDSSVGSTRKVRGSNLAVFN